jgi:hypothetical protein
MTMEDLLHVDIDHLNSGFTWLRGPSRGARILLFGPEMYTSRTFAVLLLSSCFILF